MVEDRLLKDEMVCLVKCLVTRPGTPPLPCDLTRAFFGAYSPAQPSHGTVPCGNLMK